MEKKKKVTKTTKKVNKPKTKKTTTKKNSTKKSTAKTKKKAAKKPTKKTVKKVTKKVNKTSVKKIAKKTVPKKDKWANITVTESGEIIDKSEKVEETGLTDDNGDWNGSTRSDQDIAKEQNPEKRKLFEEIDKLQEEVRRARENDEDDYYIAGLVQDIKMKEARIKEIDFKEQWGDK